MAIKEGTTKAIQDLVNASGVYLQGVGVTPTKISESAKVQKEGAQVITSIVTTPVNVIDWIAKNWQIAVVGVIALLVLLRD